MKFLLILFMFYGSIDSARILFVAEGISPSHLGSMIPFAHRLAESGDTVVIRMSLLAPKSMSSKLEERMTILNSEKIKEEQEKSQEGAMEGMFTMTIMMPMIYGPWADDIVNFNHVIANQSIDFWRIANDTFDLVVVDSLFSIEAIAQALHHKSKRSTPYIIFHSTHMMWSNANYRQLFWNDASVPPFFMTHTTGKWSERSFFDRIYAIYDKFVCRLIYDWRIQPEVRRSISPVAPKFNFRGFVHGAALSVDEYLDRLNWPVPKSNQLVHEGAYCATSKPLPEQYEVFVNDTESKGTIIIAFGNNVNWATTPKEIVEKFVKIFTELMEFRIVWGYNGHQLNLPKHIMTVKWLPQTDLLFHPKTKLFFSHGGLKSVKEAVCAEVPVLFMPLSADQVRNSFLARTHGFGEYVNKQKIVPEEIVSQIRRITSNRASCENVRRAKAVYMDRIMEALDEAAFWTHKVIARPKQFAKFFRPKPKISWPDENYFILFVIWGFLVWVAE